MVDTDTVGYGPDTAEAWALSEGTGGYSGINILDTTVAETMITLIEEIKRKKESKFVIYCVE
jgi:hypothetical protein